MDNLYKIRIILPSGPLASENLWAEKIDDKLYRLSNIPHYANGYAEGDVVSCIVQSGVNTVVGIEQHSGNGTLRLLFSQSAGSTAQAVLQELTSVGCTYERASERLVAMTVPPTLEISFSQLANYLNSIDDMVLTGWDVGKRLTRLSA